jgi:hypothetical protein
MGSAFPRPDGLLKMEYEDVYQFLGITNIVRTARERPRLGDKAPKWRHAPKTTALVHTSFRGRLCAHGR